MDPSKSNNPPQIVNRNCVFLLIRDDLCKMLMDRLKQQSVHVHEVPFKYFITYIFVKSSSVTEIVTVNN